MDQRIVAFVLLLTAAGIISYYFLFIVGGSTEVPSEVQVVQVEETQPQTQELTVPPPQEGPALRCSDDYESKVLAENFNISITQLTVLKEEWNQSPNLGFEDFCGFLITLEAEAKGFKSTLGSVADVLIEHGYGLISKDNLGRLQLNYGF
ncbi:hypothetical protein KKC94_03985 [Patescibacteria group bacterium]|nr:hypothetical protein [Patescibacteria group bacterium]